MKADRLGVAGDLSEPWQRLHCQRATGTREGWLARPPISGLRSDAQFCSIPSGEVLGGLVDQSVVLTLLAQGKTYTAPARLNGVRYRIPASAAAEAFGWEVKEIGLCRGGVCIPTRGRAEFVTEAGICLTTFADLIGAPLAVEIAAHVVALAAPVQEKRDQLAARAAPDFALPDISGALHRLNDYRGRKVLLVTWASWCGCREDLSRWREVHDEYAPHGLTVINVAQESSVEDARPFIERAAPTHPSLIDLDHVVSDLFGFINVPTAVWIDESGMIARAPRVEHASNTFAFAHGLDCEPHLAALRRWVLENAPDMSAVEVVREHLAPTLDEQTARAEFALGWRLHQMGRKDLAELHFARAVELSPLDWTIRRGAMRLRGQDPFGVDFAAVWQEWEAQGRPDYRSLAAARRAEADNAS